MRLVFLCAFFVALVTSSGCDAVDSAPRTIDKASVSEAPPAVDANTLESQNQFASELYVRLAAQQEGNLFLSPYSISTAMAMTAAGARGETARQMADVLHLDISNDRVHASIGAQARWLASTTKQGYQLRIANRLWAQQGSTLHEAFLKTTSHDYGAGVAEVDFAGQSEQARGTINDWVAEQTAQRITELVPPGQLDASTQLVLTNAIYFKGTWAEPFQPEYTFSADFRLADGTTVDAPFMSSDGNYAHLSDEHCQVLQLPYKRGKASMLVVLPTDGEKLAELERTLTAEKVADWRQRLAREYVSIRLPKFTLRSKFPGMSAVLVEMGMQYAFSPTEANFTGLTQDRQFRIYAIVHQAFIEVNEQGTEAAAATEEADGDAPDTTFHADHPFLFLIIDHGTQAILFMGRVANPVERT